MKVKLKTIYAGTKQTCQPGGVIDVSEEEAKDLVSGGYADICEDLKIIQVEVVAEVEKTETPQPVKTLKAEKPKAKKRRRVKKQ